MSNKIKRSGLLLLLVFALSSFNNHDFYVSIYQINYNENAKRIEITSRIFIDDLNSVLYKKYNVKTQLGNAKQTIVDMDLFKKYLSDNFIIKINNETKKINFISSEIEANVFICYFNIKAISNVKSIEIKNSCLFELSNQQQNILQTTFYGKKESNLLTKNNYSFLFNK